MENEYIRERPLQEIIDKLMVPQEEEEEEKADEAAEAEDSAVERAASSAAEEKGKASALSNKRQSISKDPPGKDSKTAVAAKNESQAEIAADQEDGENEEEQKEEPIKFLENDYMEKAEMSPPKDPFGNDTMHPNLIIENAALLKIVEDSLLKTMSWLLAEKINYGHKVQAEIKDL